MRIVNDYLPKCTVYINILRYIVYIVTPCFAAKAIQITVKNSEYHLRSKAPRIIVANSHKLTRSVLV